MGRGNGALVTFSINSSHVLFVLGQGSAGVLLLNLDTLEFEEGVGPMPNAVQEAECGKLFEQDPLEPAGEFVYVADVSTPGKDLIVK